MQYPIAETFHSIQGEGTWTGTPMTFIRLAGCNVGQYSKINNVHSICTTFDGCQFICDTDYKKTLSLTEYEIADLVQGKRMCLSGGEPFLHPLGPIVRAAADQSIYVHIETSGTKDITDAVADMNNVWITCSPKKEFLKNNYAKPQEWKFLIDKLTDIENIENFLLSADKRSVFLQPINGVLSINQANYKVVMRHLEKHTNWKLSSQLHKFVGVR